MMILVTGGAGYIGSHTCLELLQANYSVVVVDNFCNSKEESLRRVEKLSGRKITLIRGDVRDRILLRKVFAEHKIDAVVHFAGLKAVGESVQKPLVYYDNNVAGSVALAEVMEEYGVRTLVFSSSATVYGNPDRLPFREDFPVGATTNPYGSSKLMIEQIYRDLVTSDPEWRIVLLRYFNPVGAHESGMIGEDPSGIPNNLMPFIAQVATGRLEELSVFGNDYATPDGTGVRDYIHVTDLALGHLAALKAIPEMSGVVAINLGTGRGFSVLEMVKAFEAVSGKKVPFRIVPRRPGDIGAYYADPTLAFELLGWKAERGIEAMCRDTWRWQSMNPGGYAEND
ncbi:UDP-glucose 4-epimerase GalE [Methylomicrobium sp. Wu6]|uniref:UDP-glucose 4-epimerase GalE n=1 Tax=Methylomicrobium sp. Wu6 TaxID=3107928 RepID=UPI002DD63E52|nr:UDP-glucose 4-epimerase GalE [Methylomicrobium sp. Wu6]MEC4750577.1 UDP-glucose 4-epimerase GalE [Methylomicrobium sp. Wu6]